MTTDNYTYAQIKGIKSRGTQHIVIRINKEGEIELPRNSYSLKAEEVEKIKRDVKNEDYKELSGTAVFNHRNNF